LKFASWGFHSPIAKTALSRSGDRLGSLMFNLWARNHRLYYVVICQLLYGLRDNAQIIVCAIRIREKRDTLTLFVLHRLAESNEKDTAKQIGKIECKENRKYSP